MTLLNQLTFHFFLLLLLLLLLPFLMQNFSLSISKNILFNRTFFFLSFCSSLIYSQFFFNQFLSWKIFLNSTSLILSFSFDFNHVPELTLFNLFPLPPNPPNFFLFFNLFKYYKIFHNNLDLTIVSLIKTTYYSENICKHYFKPLPRNNPNLF